MGWLEDVLVGSITGGVNVRETSKRRAVITSKSFFASACGLAR
jgi:hypothetical protein